MSKSTDQEVYDSLSEEERKLYNKIHKELWNNLVHNGWDWYHDEAYSDGESLYKLKLLSDYYDCIVTAIVYDTWRSMDMCGKLGIAWLEVEYEYDNRPHSVTDLKDMLAGIGYAEKNLIMIGIPFTNDYKFHQKTEKENRLLSKLNSKLLTKYNIPYLEQLREDTYEKYFKKCKEK